MASRKEDVAAYQDAASRLRNMGRKDAGYDETRRTVRSVGKKHGFAYQDKLATVSTPEARQERVETKRDYQQAVSRMQGAEAGSAEFKKNRSLVEALGTKGGYNYQRTTAEARKDNKPVSPGLRTWRETEAMRKADESMGGAAVAAGLNAGARVGDSDKMYRYYSEQDAKKAELTFQVRNMLRGQVGKGPLTREQYDQKNPPRGPSKEGRRYDAMYRTPPKDRPWMTQEQIQDEERHGEPAVQPISGGSSNMHGSLAKGTLRAPLTAGTSLVKPVLGTLTGGGWKDPGKRIFGW